MIYRNSKINLYICYWVINRYWI